MVFVVQSPRSATALTNIYREVQFRFSTPQKKKKSERIEFLVKDPAKCKIVVDYKCSNKQNNFRSLRCEISYENGKFIQHKLANVCSNTGQYKENF
jgi:hypothetical protein